MDATRTVGALDALARGLLALLVLALTLLGLARSNVDWVLSILTFGFVVVAYLAATAVTGAEPVYNAFGWSTARPRRARGRRRAVRAREMR